MTMSPKYLTQDELKRFFAAIETPRDQALFGLIYHDGLRVGEALMLTVDDVNFTTHRITIRRLKNGLGGENPLWRHTVKPLRRYLRERRDVGPYLFTGRMNRTLKDATVKKYHYQTHHHLKEPLHTFLMAYNFAKRLKTLKGLTPYEYICQCWHKEPEPFTTNPSHHPLGLNT